MYDLGVIGGMGPESSQYFYKKIIELSEVDKDQDHLSVVIVSNPKIPDRSEYILHGGISPWPILKKELTQLLTLNCENIVVICNTAHYFDKEIKALVGNRFISLIETTNEYVIKNNWQSQQVVVLGTAGTKQAKIYHSDEIDYSYPTQKEQKIISEVIDAIKRRSDSLETLGQTLNHMLKSNYPQNTIFTLACTELSMLSDYLAVNTIDPLELLALKILMKKNIRIHEIV